MLRTHRNAAAGALVVLALATASHRVAAQDTSSAGQAPQDTSAYTGGVSRDIPDSTPSQGQGAGMGDTTATADTSAVQRLEPSSDSSPEPMAKPGTPSDSTSP
jgi:hypothetical protein